MLAWLRFVFWALFDGVFFAFLMRRPRLMRYVVAAFRRFWPIFSISGTHVSGATVLVTRADDVHEVFNRTTDFLLGPVNERKILTGDFVISLDPERRYRSEKAVIRRSLPDDRVIQFENISLAAARRQVSAQGAPNPFEVVEFSERVTVAIVENFWGLPTARASSNVVRAETGPETMRLWLRKLAAVLGSREPAPYGIREIGIQCAEEFFTYVRAECARRLQGGAATQMIDHILRHSGGNLDVASRNVAGLVMTGSAVVTKAFTHAFAQLLIRPDAVRAATNAANAGDRVALGRLLIEALRFNPVFPVMPRSCPRRTTLAAGTARETEIPAGAEIIISPAAAMFDPAAVDEPDQFRPGRDLTLNSRFATPDWRFGAPPGSGPGAYLLFGGGEHWCPGDQMAVAELTSIGMVLLQELDAPRIHRKIAYDGPAVASLLVAHGQ